MTIPQIIATRGIEEILHFTTNKGLIGILASRSLKSRKRLPKDKYLEHVYSANCKTRRDVAWLDYVNLSITDIDARLFEISSDKWHKDKDVWWCILAFASGILDHPDVHLSTTNNMYSGVKRGTGGQGLEALFKDRIHQYEGRYITRSPEHLPNQPTDPQAEVLYPGEVSTKHLKKVYVVGNMHRDTAKAMLSSVDHEELPIEKDPGKFR